MFTSVSPLEELLNGGEPKVEKNKKILFPPVTLPACINESHRNSAFMIFKGVKGLKEIPKCFLLRAAKLVPLRLVRQ